MGILLSRIVQLSKQAMIPDRIATANRFLFTVQTLHKSDSCPLTIAIPVNVKLRLLTHVGLFRQNCLKLSEVVLYMERSKNHGKNYIITVQKKFTFLRRFDRKNTVFAISGNLIDKPVFK